MSNIQHRYTTSVAALAAGLAALLLVASGLLARRQPWWSDTLLSIGTTGLLAVPLWWFSRHLDSRVHEAESRAESAQIAAQSARSDVAELEASVERRLTPLEEARETLLGEQSRAASAVVDIYRQWGIDASRDALLAVLQEGAASGLISRQGIRAAIWETNVHLWFSIDSNNHVRVCIVDDSGKPMFGTVWGDHAPPIELFRELDEAMNVLGQHLGPMLFDPTESIQVASESLAHAAGRRLQWSMNGSHYLQRIIEYVDGWYITEGGVISREHDYFIEKDRLDDFDWEDHVSAKGWTGIQSALRVARAIHGVAISASDPSHEQR